MATCRRWLRNLAALTFGLVLVTGCATDTPPRPGPTRPTVEAPPPAPPLPTAELEEMRIGLLLPLSGQHGDIGQALLNAATMATFDSGDPRLVLKPMDTRGTPSGATDAMRALVSDGVDIIVGPLLAGEVRAIAPYARAEGLNVIAFSTDRTVAGDNVYLLSFTPDDEVEAVVRYAAEQGHTRFAALVPETPYGATVSRAFIAAVRDARAEIADIVSYPPDTSALFDPVREITRYDDRADELRRERDFLESLGEDDLAAEILDSLKNLETLGDVPYDAILLPEGSALLRVLAPLLPYYEVDPREVRFLGTGLWNDPTIVREPQLVGGWFAAPGEDRVQAFQERYRALYRREPPRIATLGYDAAALVATLVNDGTRPPFTAEELADPNGFQGLDGIFRFRRNGVAERGLAILGVTRRGFTVLSPAPDTFVPPPPKPEWPLLPDLDEQSFQDMIQNREAPAGDAEPAAVIIDQPR